MTKDRSQKSALMRHSILNISDHECSSVVNKQSDFDVQRWTFDVGRSSAATSGFRVKPAHQKDNQADQQNQAEPAAADGRSANIKTAAAEQEKKNDDEKE
jgi:hypothetical protein